MTDLEKIEAYCRHKAKQEGGKYPLADWLRDGLFEFSNEEVLHLFDKLKDGYCFTFRKMFVNKINSVYLKDAEQYYLDCQAEAQAERDREHGRPVLSNEEQAAREAMFEEMLPRFIMIVDLVEDKLTQLPYCRTIIERAKKLR